MNSSSQVQELPLSSSTHIECSILSRSAGNLPLSITWFFSSAATSESYRKILETDQTDVVKYGDEFQTPQSKQKFYSEKVSQDLFLLNILNMEDSDRGHYHCVVEEWFLATNGTWQKLGRKTSGLTELKLRPTGKPRKGVVIHLSIRWPAFLQQPLGCDCEEIKAIIWPGGWWWQTVAEAGRSL